MSAAQTKANAAWGADLPSWVAALAVACDQASQRAVAQRIGYSPAVVSTVLGRSYRGDLTAVQTAIEGALMAVTVACPILGRLTTDLCRHYQQAAYSTANPLRIQLFRACRAGCPHSRL